MFKKNIPSIIIKCKYIFVSYIVFKTSDYDLNLKEREATYDHYNHILCEKCNLEIDKQYYYCTFCYSKINNSKQKNRIKNGLDFGIFKSSDYDLNLKERKTKYGDYVYILCEKCDQKIDKHYYCCLVCYNKITDINKRNHMKYGLNFEIFKTSDYDLNLEKRKAKYKDFKTISCEECSQEIDKHYYYCLSCYNKITDINKRNHMKYGLNFGSFKTSDYDLNLEKRKAKYKDFKIILCEKCNREIDKQLCYCKYCFIKELNYDKKVQMKCVLKTGILKTSDYDLSINEKQTKFENCDSIICEKCNCEIINLHYYRCDKCYFKADDYERQRMTYGICKYCSEINSKCSCLPSLNQLIKEFEKFNEIYESKVNGNSIFKQPITIISDYDLNEDDRREKCKDYYDILCEKCNEMFSYSYCHVCGDEKKQKLKELQVVLQNFEKFYNELYDKETNNLKNSNELRLIIQSNKYIYPKVNRFEGIHLQIKKVITEYIMPIKSELIAIKQSPEVCFHTIRSYCDCYYMETDISEKKRMEFGKCKECLNIHEDLNGCLSCNPQRFQRDFNKWTSGNEIIDRLIQENQLLVRRYGLLEWIPYDRFTNINYIAEGGFAKVYSATWIDGQIKKWSQLSNNWRRNGSTVVALKVLNSSENISEDFLNEALSGYMCVIKCFGITQDPITYDYALVLQYMENGDLRKYLKRTINTLTWKRRMSNIYDICLAIDNIHKHRLMHKDLHPGNIFIDSTFAYIGDFGFCMPANENIKNSTKKNIYGVLPYMAPEILRGKPHTLASDIYSLGVIINEIITVIPPFNNQPHDLYLALDICRGLRPNIRSETPDSLKELIKKCWDAKPENRPTSKEILCKLSDNLSEYKNIPIIRLSYNLNESNEIQLHPLASYTSRLLNFQNLPEPINCPNQQEFTSSRYMKIQTGQVNILRSNECSDCIIVNTD
ncbi:kinase-like domain-containing protein [Rhizophagus clarus]|uniref:Kinase-like domain-containing protein n=1 Tax=Rhizophagus clarus TaxID=94130 RepID=A0A8H3LSY5_9GLOM|nr:kinase-like domain-containing protein [Rhizophagus clarus]